MLVGLIDPSDPAIRRQMQEFMRTRHYAARTERSYTGWACRFAQFARGWDNVASTVISALRLDRRVMNAERSGGGRQRIGGWRAFSGGSEGWQGGARAGKPELRLRGRRG
ncbi:MAG: phage integrase N-terminal SAM-like domain-containing protein [Planctomyces sp.]